MKRLRISVGSLIVLAYWIMPAYAERAPERREDASHVVTGTVNRVYGRDWSPSGWLAETYTDFVLALAVDGVEKGEGLINGQIIYVHCFQCTRMGFAGPGMAGHTRIPKPGEQVRAFLNLRKFKQIGSPLFYPAKKGDAVPLPERQEGTGYEVVYPSGIDWLDGSSNSEVPEQPSRAIALDYWWLFLLGVAAGGVGGCLVSWVKGRRKLKTNL